MRMHYAARSTMHLRQLAQYADTLHRLGKKKIEFPEGYHENSRREYGHSSRYARKRTESFAVMGEGRRRSVSINMQQHRNLRVLI